MTIRQCDFISKSSSRGNSLLGASSAREIRAIQLIETTATSHIATMDSKRLDKGVVIFCKVYNWDDLVVLIREFKTVRIKAEWRLPWLKDDTLGPVKSILHTEIIGAIGFIRKVEETRTVTYVTTHWSEKKEEK